VRRWRIQCHVPRRIVRAQATARLHKSV
jgi:hypothetical protein